MSDSGLSRDVVYKQDLQLARLRLFGLERLRCSLEPGPENENDAGMGPAGDDVEDVVKATENCGEDETGNEQQEPVSDASLPVPSEEPNRHGNGNVSTGEGTASSTTSVGDVVNEFIEEMPT